MDYKNLKILENGCPHSGDSELVGEEGTVSTKRGDYFVMHCVHCGYYKVLIKPEEPAEDDLEEGDLEREAAEIFNSDFPGDI